MVGLPGVQYREGPVVDFRFRAIGLRECSFGVTGRFGRANGFGDLE